MKKLLSLSPHMSTGGAPQVLVKRIELIKDYFDVYVVEFNNYSNDFVIQKNRIKKLIDPSHFFTLSENKFEILDIIKNINPDYIHFEEIPELFNIDFEITKSIYDINRKYKIFETTHSSDFNVDNKIFFPDKFLFVSQYNCFKFNKFGIPSEVIEYPVEKMIPDKEKKLLSLKKLNLDPDFKHVLNVGLFTPRKNQAYAFEIARKLQEEKIKFHFIGNQAENFQDYWKPLLKTKPKNCILWNERDDVDTFLDACDLFLFTSMGFRWNKELNPLVIKEALEHQIPQFLFPLDVYNRKYDIEDTVHYLNGDVNIDSKIIKNFLFKNDTPNNNYNKNKYKIKAVHLLLEEDDRKKESILNLEKLKDYGIDYIQHINERYIDIPPKYMCARPQDVGRIGSYSLRGPHYGNYQSFKKAILTEANDDIDFLIIFESDCKLNIPLEEFVEKIFQSCEHVIERNIYYMSFGDDRNLRTGELVSNDHGRINDWMYITNKIIGIQSIMFPKFAFDFIKRSYETTLWDVSDLMFNEMFKYKTKAIAPRLTTQIEGISTIQGEKIEHFLLKNVDNLINDKNINDVIVEFNKNDQKFYFCLSDFYQNDIDNISINVNADDKKGIYNISNITLSPHLPIWIQIYGHHKYKEFTFEIYQKDIYLFTKKIEINITPNNDRVLDNIKKVIEKDKNDILINSKDFDIDYNIEESRIYIPYNGQIKEIELDVEIKNIKTKDLIYKAKNLIFNKEYCNWIYPGVNYEKDEKIQGFEIDFIKNEHVLFKKDFIFENKKKDIEIEEIIENKNNDTLFIVLTYPDTKIKEDITEKCIDSLKNSNYKILISSHYPLNKKLQDKSDYYIYDSYNPLINHTLYNSYWSIIPEGKIEINLNNLKKSSNLNQSLAVLNNINNSIRFSKAVGFKKIICVNYDFIFNSENMKTINEICEKINKEEKQGYFMKYEEGNMSLYKSVFFIINVDFYIKVFNEINRTPLEYNNECEMIGSHNFLENYFYSKLLKYSDELIIEETNEDKLFNNSNINIFSGVEYLTLLPIKNSLNNFLIWFNSSNNKDNRRIEFIIDNKGNIEKYTHYVKERSYYFKKIFLSDGDDYNITVNFIDSIDNKIIETQKFNINHDNFNDILNNGLFTEK